MQQVQDACSITFYFAVAHRAGVNALVWLIRLSASQAAPAQALKPVSVAEGFNLLGEWFTLAAEVSESEQGQ